MTPWVRRLLIANVVAFLLTSAAPGLVAQFGLIPREALFRPWTLITYMFLHGGFTHILFNMLMLFFFGPRLEERLGSRTFILFYVFSGVGGAVLSFGTPNALVIGASGAIFGVVLGFARYWPREEIYIWGVLPIQARMLALFMIVSSLLAGVWGARDGIAHFAHLGGLVAGWAFLKQWERRLRQRIGKPAVTSRRAATARDVGAIERWEAIPRHRLHEINRDEVEHLLVKARSRGTAALTPAEREFLDRISGAFSAGT